MKIIKDNVFKFSFEVEDRKYNFSVTAEDETLAIVALHEDLVTILKQLTK
jgi:hypothetical protein